MNFCPNNAHLYGEHEASLEQEKKWCSRRYKPGSEQCAGCDLRERFGVGADKVKGASVG